MIELELSVTLGPTATAVKVVIAVKAPQGGILVADGAPGEVVLGLFILVRRQRTRHLTLRRPNSDDIRLE